MKLNIPFFSQLDARVPEDIQRSVCAIACAKMILDNKDTDIPFNDLYKEGMFVGGTQSAGWNHEAIVRVLRNHGVPAYRQEFLAHTIDLDALTTRYADHSDTFAEAGISKIKKNIDEGNPVVVSVVAGFSRDIETKTSLNMEHHVVLVTGYDNDGFLVSDPLLVQGKGVKVSFEHFNTFWRKFAIFVE